MKALFLLVFLSVFFLTSQAEESKVIGETKPISKDIDESLKIKKKSDEKQNQIKNNKQKKSQKKEEEAKKSSEASSGVVTKKIKAVFIDFLEILDKETIGSNEYAKAVRFLENSLYNEASFETLKVLAAAYEEKDDFQNQIKVLNILSVNYFKKAESFYLLGMAYKNLYLKDKNGDDRKEYKKKAIATFNQALKLNKKYFLAYQALMTLLMTKNSKTEEDIHTTESLSVAIEMLRNLRKNKHYIQLCKAYYDNNFLKQSRKACAVSVKKNKKDPISPLILALSRNKKEKTDKELLQVAEKFKKSLFVQYKTALYFMDKEDPKVAITYFDRAYALQPDNIKLNKIISWFLFDNKEERKSYKHFLKVCLSTDGKFLRAFRSARNQLRSKKMPELLFKFQKGIDKCFYSAKKKKRKNK